jgi:flagellar basal-body rod protein FlgG
VAIQGNGFFQVTMPDGTTGYTRDGSFQVDAQGRLVTSSGLPWPMASPCPANAAASPSADGTVTASIPGSTTPQPIGNIALASFINPAGLEPQGQNLFAESAGLGPAATGHPGTNGLGA